MTRALLIVVAGFGVASADVAVTMVAKPPAGARADRFGEPLPAKAIARFGSARLYHGGPVVGVEVVGDYLASVGAGLGHHGPTVRFWDPKDGRLVAHAMVPRVHSADAAGSRLVIADHESAIAFETTPKISARLIFRDPKAIVRDVVITRDGATAAVLTDPCQIHLVTLDKPGPNRTITCDLDDPRTVAVSDARLVAAGDKDGELVVIDTRDKVVLRHVPKSAHTAPDLAFVPNSTDLVEANHKRLVRWDVTKQQPRWDRSEAFSNHAKAIEISSDGRSIVMAGAETAVLDAQTGAVRWSTPSGPSIPGHEAPAFWGTNRILVGTHNGSIEIYDAASRARIHLHPTADEPIEDLAFADDDRLLALGEKLYAYSASAPMAPATTLPETPVAIMIAPRRLDTVIVQDDQKSLRALDATTMKPKASLAGRAGWLRAMSPDGAFIYTSEFHAFDRIATATMTLANVPKQPKEVACVAPGAGGAFAAVANEGTVADPKFRLMRWSASGALTTSAIPGDDAPIECVDINGEIVLGTFSELMIARRSGKLERRKRPMWKLAADPIRARVAFADTDEAIGILDVATGKTTELGRHEGRVDGLTFSPNGKLLATGSVDQTIIIWDVR